MARNKRKRAEKARARRAGRIGAVQTGRRVTLVDLAAEWDRLALNIHDEESGIRAGDWLINLLSSWIERGMWDELNEFGRLVYGSCSDRAAEGLEKMWEIILTGIFGGVVCVWESGDPSPMSLMIGESVPDSGLTEKDREMP